MLAASRGGRDPGSLSRKAPRWARAAWLAAATALLTPGTAPAHSRKLPALTGELTLDAAAPIVTVVLGGVTLRLRVDLAQWDRIELNATAAARLPLAWESGQTIEIGRVALPGRGAETVMRIGERAVPVLVVEHGVSAIAGADGIVGPDTLPFATIRWRRSDAPPPNGTLALPLDLDPSSGLDAAAPDAAVPIRLHFSLARDSSAATASAGSLLLRRYGGRFEGPARPLPIILGVSRPARLLAIDRSPRLAGFRYPTLLVRVADFRGNNPLPSDPTPPGDIVVAHRERPQDARPWLTIALDRLARCADITYTAAPRTLTLDCAFDR